KLLPKEDDCKDCGASSCFVFAGKVATGQAKIQDCKRLFQDQRYAAQREQLLAMLAESV
ncbi:MAG: tRNA CCA-pyrophosphorylase, partial [Anaerolineae bacterium]|nr:tRNA CCA-pyrophosphorylase [Anaerolineae bacterium]